MAINTDFLYIHTYKHIRIPRHSTRQHAAQVPQPLPPRARAGAFDFSTCVYMYECIGSSRVLPHPLPLTHIFTHATEPTAHRSPTTDWSRSASRTCTRASTAATSRVINRVSLSFVLCVFAAPWVGTDPCPVWLLPPKTHIYIHEKQMCSPPAACPTSRS